MLTLHRVTYVHPNGDRLFSDLDLTINKNEKVALIGNNGVGKSTLMKIMACELLPTTGTMHAEAPSYYLPQLSGNEWAGTVAEALRIHGKLNALKQILDGEVNDTNLNLLAGDWSIEERCAESFSRWGLAGLEVDMQMKNLSGGEKTKVLLAGIMIHEPDIVLLDEPSNHLDASGRQILYNFISATTKTVVLISHDRTLLNLVDVTCMLGRDGITRYGGNYEFYSEQKSIYDSAIVHALKSKEKELRKARETERDALERKQKLDARGKRKQQNAGLPTIMMNTFRNNAEKSAARLKETHVSKINDITQQVLDLRSEAPNREVMKMNFDNSSLQPGKVLISAHEVNVGFGPSMLWDDPLTFQILSGERIAIQGCNGSGKTTLVNMMLGNVLPSVGTIQLTQRSTVYVDQEYSILDGSLSVYDQAQAFNANGLREHEIKVRLNRFLFPKDAWNKNVTHLSGGEKMRLVLCCLSIGTKAPDMIILDEPTNNLDLESLEVLAGALNDYDGTLVVISHDKTFLTDILIGRFINLK
ncbi:MAG TPA: ABC-F family ATP-binding cassette domain-containing protein [Chryseosolibacter sp.]